MHANLQKLLPLQCGVPLHQPEVCLRQIQEQSSVEPPWLLPVPAQIADALVRGLAPAASPFSTQEDTGTDGVCVTHTLSVTEKVLCITWTRRKCLTMAEELLAQLIVCCGATGSPLSKPDIGRIVAQTLSAHGL